MNAGLPGTGIGGLFYILGAFLMLALEIGFTLAGKGSTARWKKVIEQVGIAFGIIGALWLTGIVLSALIPQKIDVLMPLITTETNKALYTALLFASPFFILTSVVTLAWIAGIIVQAHTTHIQKRSTQ